MLIGKFFYNIFVSLNFNCSLYNPTTFVNVLFFKKRGLAFPTFAIALTQQLGME